MPLYLIGLFFIVAVVYAAVGFGGGSTYSALLVLSGTDYRILPAIALACNIVVVSGGVWRFSKERLLDLNALLPFLIVSVPAAWIGGRLPISEAVFVGLLGSALLVSGLRLLLQHDFVLKVQDKRSIPFWTAGVIGGGIGLLSGLVGIGGGIFLAPILYILRWDTPLKIAGACSLFILVNSVAGLSGQIMKLSDSAILFSAVSYWPLILTVFFGGQIGSWMATKRFDPVLLKRLTAALILYVGVRLLIRWMGYL